MESYYQCTRCCKLSHGHTECECIECGQTHSHKGTCSRRSVQARFMKVSPLTARMLGLVDERHTADMASGVFPKQTGKTKLDETERIKYETAVDRSKRRRPVSDMATVTGPMDYVAPQKCSHTKCKAVVRNYFKDGVGNKTILCPDCSA